MRLAALAALALPLAACPASDATCEAAAETEGVLEIGTGEADFEPLADGDALQVHWGPQGGQHVYGALRAEGLVSDPTNFDPDLLPVVDFTVTSGDTFLAGYEELPRFFQHEGDVILLVGDTLPLEWIEAWAEEGWDGRDVTIAAHVVDPCGRELSAERAVRLKE